MEHSLLLSGCGAADADAGALAMKLEPNFPAGGGASPGADRGVITKELQVLVPGIEIHRATRSRWGTPLAMTLSAGLHAAALMALVHAAAHTDSVGGAAHMLESIAVEIVQAPEPASSASMGSTSAPSVAVSPLEPAEVMPPSEPASGPPGEQLDGSNRHADRMNARPGPPPSSKVNLEPQAPVARVANLQAEPATIDPLVAEPRPDAVASLAPTVKAEPNSIEPARTEQPIELPPEAEPSLPEKVAVVPPPIPAGEPVESQQRSADRQPTAASKTSSSPAVPPPSLASAAAPEARSSRATTASQGAVRAFARRVAQALAKSPPTPQPSTGTVEIAFTVGLDGSLGELTVERSSGSPPVDQAAVAAVRGARLPQPPAGASEKQRSFVIPYHFRRR